MAGGYKVRIGDGSEIGGMDLAAVKSWYAQGLLHKDSPVLKPGTKRWSTLAEALDLQGGSSAASRPAGVDGGGARGRSASSGITIDVPHPSRWRTPAAGGLLVVLSLALGYFAYRRQDVRVELQDAPWTEVALGVLAMGLVLLPGWDLGRKIVRLLMVLLAFLLFPAAGILIAQGVRGVALLAVLGAWVCFSGFVALLAGDWISWGRLILALLPVLAGGAGFVYFTHSPETPARREVREWTAPERRFTDDSLGMSLEVPRGWVVLKAGNPLVAPPPEARVALAHPRGQGFGFLTAESSPQGIGSVEQYLDRVWSARMLAHPGLTQTGQGDVEVGGQPAKRLLGSFDADGGRYQEAVTVWRDGWIYFAMVGWLPEANPRAGRELEALVEGVATQGVFAARLQSALVDVTMEVPQLTPTAAELLMGGSAAKVLEPDQAFRRSIEALSKALPALSKQDAQELGQITSATYAALPARERSVLAAYVARVRERQPTTAAQDKEASQIMKSAVLRLAPPRRTRLQAYYEQAIRAAAASP